MLKKMMLMALLVLVLVPSVSAMGMESDSRASYKCGVNALVFGIFLNRALPGAIPTLNYGLHANDFCSGAKGNSTFEIPANSPLLRMPGVVIHLK